MLDLSRNGLASHAWITLRQLEFVQREGRFAELGWTEEFRGVATAMYPKAASKKAVSLGYNDINPTWPHKPFVQDGRYKSAGVILPERGLAEGRHLVLEQSFDNSAAREDWHLDQDLVLGLGLVRIGDDWTAPAEDGMLVARLRRGEDGRPVSLEILAEHLRDFLTARKCGLVITTYMSRSAVLQEPASLRWESGARRDVAGGHWEGFFRAVHPSGLPFGEKISVTRVYRTDATDAGDAPVFDMFDSNVASNHYEREHSGGPFFHVEGSLHRTDWFGPGSISLRVLGDRETLTGISYKVGADGSMAAAEDLLKPPVRYLYFRPQVIRDLTSRSSGSLGWYTAQTGEVGLRGYTVPFGVSPTGLVNVIASDICELPAAIQRIWAAENVTPDGPVSRELLSAQMAAQPASSIAPEAVLFDSLMQLDATWTTAFGHALLRDLDNAYKQMTDACNRFQALDDRELRRLAKDVARYVIERIDERYLRTLAPAVPAGTQDERRSLALVEAILSSRGLDVEPIAMLRAVNELRQDDSHLTSKDRTAALARLGLTGNLPYPHKSAKLIGMAVVAMDRLTHQVASSLGPSDLR